jgi:hypothetical protein
MASRKDLKQGINNLTFELISECYTYILFHPEKEHEKTNAAMQVLVDTRNTLVDKINNPTDAKDYKKNRAFFRAIVKDMNNMVSVMDNLG